MSGFRPLLALRVLVGLVVVLIVLGVLGFSAATEPGLRAHLVGRSEPVTGQVLTTRPAGRLLTCFRRQGSFTVELRLSRDESGTTRVCGPAPRRGDEVAAYRSPDGSLWAQPAWRWWVAVLVPAALLALLLALAWRLWRHRSHPGG